MGDIKKYKNQFYIGEDATNPLAKIIIASKGKSKIIIESTYVSHSLRGQGTALQLVKKVVEYARLENKKIIARCPYAKKVMRASGEYRDILIIF